MAKKYKEFLKAQLSAFLGGLVDFGIYSFCYKVLQISASYSNVVSGSLGAIVNFTINRYWSFNNTTVPLASQLWKFVIVVIGSITLKSLGIHLFVDQFYPPEILGVQKIKNLIWLYHNRMQPFF